MKPEKRVTLSKFYAEIQRCNRRIARHTAEQPFDIYIGYPWGGWTEGKRQMGVLVGGEPRLTVREIDAYIGALRVAKKVAQHFKYNGYTVE